jgi:hypothetical protein
MAPGQGWTTGYKEAVFVFFQCDGKLHNISLNNISCSHYNITEIGNSEKVAGGAEVSIGSTGRKFNLTFNLAS